MLLTPWEYPWQNPTVVIKSPISHLRAGNVMAISVSCYRYSEGRVFSDVRVFTGVQVSKL